MDTNARAIFEAHEGGKLQVLPRRRILSRDDLSIVYTPGVAEVCMAISKDRALAKRYTMAGRTVAVVSDGSAVLGLGDIGPEAAMPVMEGKAALFKTFAGLDAFPICLRAREVDDIVAIVRALAPTFAAINLEDISAPRCFAIEERLQDLGIPVMHDDQHGTAVVVLAALTNACRVAGRSLGDVRVVVSGAGAAGMAIAALIAPRVADVVLVDSQGAVCSARADLHERKRLSLLWSNRGDSCGTLAEALRGAEVFIGVSKPGVLDARLIATMAPRPIVFAMANPVPEIMPDAALAGGAAVVATGRSDFPNQVNNALAFPGIFRGAIDVGATAITEAMQLAAAEALAACVVHPSSTEIIPSIFDPAVVPAVAGAVGRAWQGAPAGGVLARVA